MLHNVVLYWKKLETLLFDRRLLYYIFVTVFMALGMPYTVDHAVELEGEAIELVKAISIVIEIIIGMVTLLHSWGIRPPSGKQGDVLLKLQEMLEKAGVDL